MIRGVPVTKRTGDELSSEEAILKRKVIVAVEYLIIAILAIGTFYVVSMFTLFAPSYGQSVPFAEGAAESRRRGTL